MAVEPAAGVLPVDKPEGPTSHDVVAQARRALHVRRIGHTGTLDPFASGLLLLCIGWATRLAEYLTGLPKTYVAVARVGVTTDSADPTGSITAVSERWRELEPETIARAFQEQVGTFLQTPPRFSAKKVGGERLHRLARRGEDVEAPPARITVYELEILELDPPDVRFRVQASAGTYIRAIARDAGEALGTGAHLVALRRTRIGPHDVSDALPLDELGDAAARRRAMLSPADALGHLPAVDLGAEALDDIAHGRSRPLPENAADSGLVRVLHDGRLVAVADTRGGRLQPRKVFPHE